MRLLRTRRLPQSRYCQPRVRARHALLATVLLLTGALQAAPELLMHLAAPADDTPVLADQSKHGHDGRAMGDMRVPANAAGFLFDGEDDVVLLQKSASLRLQEFTLAFWMTPLGHENSDHESVIRGPSGNGYSEGWRLFLKAIPAARVLSFSANFGSAKPVTCKIGSLPLGTPTHIAISVGRREIVFYLNGKETGRTDRDGDIAYSKDTSPMQLGFSHYQNYHGSMSDVRLYDGAISSEAVAALATRPPEQITPKRKPVSVKTWFRPDQLGVPDYELSTNLVQNPSFEGGGHYWEALTRFISQPREELYAIDTTHAHSGLRSLRLHGFAGEKSNGYLKTFAIPVVPRETYTVSFYCRGTAGRSVAVRLYTGTWPGKLPGGGYQPFLLSERVPLTDAWTRHSFTVTAPNNAMSPVFFTEDQPDADYVAWIDDVQLEAGDTASAFTSKPIAAELVTSSFDSTVEPGMALDARLAIHSRSAENASLRITVEDIHGQELETLDRKVALPANQRTELPLPFDGRPWFRSGLYVLRVELTTAAGFRDVDWFRFGKMTNLAGTHPHRTLFSYYGMFGSVPNTEIAAREEMHMGLGSSIPFAAVPDPEWVEICRRNGILIASSIFRKGAESRPGDGRQFQSIPGRSVNVKGNWSDGKWPDPKTAVAAVEENAFGVAQANPGIRHWKLTNEPSHSVVDDPAKLKLFVDLMRAAAKGIRRAQPDARIMTPDPTNMYPGNGIREMEHFAKAGMLEFCDIVAIHPYRPRPEEPDFDADTQALLDMLQRYKFTGEIWFTEGIYFTPYRLPQFGLEPTKFSDFWRCGPFSYDIGTGERMAAAYQMRMWLTALKYSSRVRQMTGGVKDRLLDINRTPRAVVWAPNTLGHLLGDSAFVDDIDVGDGARGYLFTDGASRPVVAIWNTDPDVDDEKAEPQTCTIPFGDEPFEVFDAFGAVASMQSFDACPIRPLPTFIRGKAGRLATFRAALEKLTRPEGAPSPIAAQLRVKDTRTLQILLTSKRSRPLQTRVTLRVGPEETSRDLDLSPHQTIPLAFPIQGDTTKGVTLPIRVSTTTRNGSEATILDDTLTLFAVPRQQAALRIDGDLADWGKALVPMASHLVEYPPTRKACGNRLPEFVANPPVWKGGKDLSGEFAMRWDEKALYLAVRVTDDVVRMPPQADHTYNFDSLQFYLDTFGDARTRRVQGYDNNDWSFDIATVGADTHVTRGQVPEWQLCFLNRGPATGVQAACRTIPGGYAYELAFPKDEIQPLRLADGNVFGSALMVNENDGDYRKRALTLTPPGTEPHRRPHLYPVFILTD